MLFSVVTVTYNAVDLLEKTIDSILGQTSTDFEYIIIDGGSCDGTVDLIEKHSSRLSYWCSEKDSGIYNAMNKAIRQCRGEWVIFMNAGDTFASNEILGKIAPYCTEQADLIYGDRNRVNANGQQRAQKAGQLHDAYQREVVFHQSCFIRTSLLHERAYDESYKLAADYEFTLYALKNNKNFIYSGITISNFLEGGASNKNYLLSHIEAIKASITHFPDSSLLHENFFFRSLVTRNIFNLISSQIQNCKNANENFKLGIYNSDTGTRIFYENSTPEFSYLIDQINRSFSAINTEEKLACSHTESTLEISQIKNLLNRYVEENRLLLKQLHLAQERLAQQLKTSSATEDAKPLRTIYSKIKRKLRNHLPEKRAEQLHKLKLSLYKALKIANYGTIRKD